MAACGQTVAVTDSVGIDDFPAFTADALCNNIGPCCLREGFPFDQTQCRATAIARLTEQIEEVKARGHAYDGSAARTCIDALAEAARICTQVGIDIIADVEARLACDGVFTGRRVAGESCDSSNDCLPKLHCVGQPGGGAGSGQCVVPPAVVHGKEGDSCSLTCTVDDVLQIESCSGSGPSGSSDVPCFTNDGLQCDFSSRVCTRMPKVGEACTESSVCAERGVCDNGTCGPLRTSGPCSTAFIPCHPDTAYCDFQALECRPRKAVGEPCMGSNECGWMSTCPNGVCKSPTIASSSFCAGNLK